jgi:spore coat polysaccharide biosynthesis predicted glycosyltransferase SpsG
LISNRSIVGKNHALFEISTDESEDIDTVSDLRRVQEICDRGLVIFRLTANKTVGSGHLFHCLQLAEQLDHHKILFVLKNCDDFVAELLREQGRDFEIEIELEDVLRSYASFDKKIVVNDILDTERSEILLEKFYGFKVLNIEDLGDGAEYADLVVNALYHQTSASPNSKTLSGPRYATLRPEFHDLPSKNIATRASRLLITFGGTDPAKLTHRVSRVASQIPDLQITAILGIGAEDILPIKGVTIRRNVKNMALEMHSSDLVITAAGRTVFEAAATGTPVLSIAQNARESTHSHLDIESGVVFLGIGEEISDLEIKLAIERLIENTALRVELSNKIVQLVDTKGVQRIANHIETLMKELH